MGFYRAIPKGNPYSMAGGFCYSGWQTEKAGYLNQIRFNTSIRSLNINNTVANTYDFSDPNYPDYPVFGTSSVSTTRYNNVTGLNISDYDKLYLNANCSNMFNNCGVCTNWTDLNKLDFTYVTDCFRMFANCYSLNQPVIIGNSVTNCNSMFSRCNSFNQSVIIPNSVTDCSYMFNGCNEFSQSVIIPDSVTDCRNMFRSCKYFNKSVTIGNNVTRCDAMFAHTLFNQPITIPNGVTYCSNMFASCNNFVQSITIPESVTRCDFMFNGLNNTVPVTDIYIKGNTFREINVVGMLAYYNTAFNINRNVRTNIHFNKVLQNQFNKTTVNNSLTNTAITWSTTSGGYRNTTAKIYLYNNYEG